MNLTLKTTQNLRSLIINSPRSKSTNRHRNDTSDDTLPSSPPKRIEICEPSPIHTSTDTCDATQPPLQTESKSPNHDPIDPSDDTVPDSPPSKTNRQIKVDLYIWIGLTNCGMADTFPCYLGLCWYYLLGWKGDDLSCFFACLFVIHCADRCVFSCIHGVILWLRFVFGIVHPGNLTLVWADENKHFLEHMRHFSILIGLSTGQ